MSTSWYYVALSLHFRIMLQLASNRPLCHHHIRKFLVSWVGVKLHNDSIIAMLRITYYCTRVHGFTGGIPQQQNDQLTSTSEGTTISVPVHSHACVVRTQFNTFVMHYSHIKYNVVLLGANDTRDLNWLLYLH